MKKPSPFPVQQLLEPYRLTRTATACAGQNVSYAELIEMVETRAGELRAVGADGDVIAIWREKSTEYIVDLLAILMIGAVAMPIDPRLPPARCAVMMDVVPPQVIISHDGTAKSTGHINVISNHPDRGERPGYVMFTSGSTGRPKAILGTIWALLHFIQWQGAEFKLSETDRVSFLTPIGFDVSLRDIFLPLLHGAALVIPAERDTTTPNAIVKWLETERISIIHVVPSVAQLWARSMGDAKPLLRTVFLAGEKLYPSVVAELRSAFGHTTEYINLYGPSETTLAKFFSRIELTQSASDAPIPVGRPLPGASFGFVTGGTSGEVVITTCNATLGYIGADAAEAAKFSKGLDGEISYRTGDLGETTPNGELVIIGRADDEIKVNGVRVHPNEVTQCLSGFHAAQDIHVFATTTGSAREPRLAAIWIAKPGEDALEDTAPRKYALQQLPQAIVPTLWRKVTEFPKNANGKIDRNLLTSALARPFDEAGASETETEAWLTRLIANILECETPSPMANLFGLGATSLHVAFLIGKIEDELGKSLDFADVFAVTRLSDIAALIDGTPTRKTVALPPLQPSNLYRMAPQQRRWWNIYIPERNRSWATMVRIMSFDHHLEPKVLKRGLLDLVQNQDSMRLSFVENGDEIWLRETEVTSETTFPISVSDFSSLANEEAAAMLDELRLEVANSEIATDTWPLFRAKIAYLPEGKSAVVFAMHHMISDGFSMNIVDAQLRQYIDRGAVIPEPPKYNYLSYAAWAREQELTLYGAGSEAQSYWAEVFDKPYQKHLFMEKWKGPDHDRGQGLCVKVPTSTRLAVKAFARRHKVTEFSVYFAAKFKVLHRILKRSDLVVGTPAAGRELKGAEDLVGNFISLVCVRSCEVAGQTSLGHVRQTMQKVAHAMTYQNYQYDTLVKDMGMEFEQSRLPLTTMFISHLNFGGSNGSSFDVREEGFSDLGFAVKFDLMSYVREHKGATSLLVQFRNNLFYKQEIEAFIAGWIEELNSLVEPEATPQGLTEVDA